MLGLGTGADAKAVLKAMGKSQAIIEFKPDGTIITANENFCHAVGYQLSEIVVQSGVALVGTTGKALQEIVSQVVQVDANVGAIVEASKEQTTGLKEINMAVNTMDQGTQQNAAMVEETTAAAHSLAKEAEQLFQLLSQFNIGSGGGAHRNTKTAAPSKPVSAVRQMTAKVAHAFNGNAALKAESWEEF